MTKKKKSVFGFDAIEQMAASSEDNKPQQGNDLNKVNTKTEQEGGTVKRNSEGEQADGSGDGTMKPKQENETGNGFIEQFKEKATRKTVEDTHRRQTYLIHKELIKRLDRLARRQPKGFKTAVINEGIRRVLDEVEGK